MPMYVDNYRMRKRIDGTFGYGHIFFSFRMIRRIVMLQPQHSQLRILELRSA